MNQKWGWLRRAHIHFLNMQNWKLSDFTIIKQLHSGRRASTYHAKRNSDKQEVCIKRISESRMARNEAQTHSQLHHKNIIEYFGSFVENDKFYLVMEYAERGSLLNLVHSGLPEQAIFRTLLQITDGLYCIHIFIVSFISFSVIFLDLRSRNIIHGDVKPDNILVGLDGWFGYQLHSFSITRFLGY